MTASDVVVPDAGDLPVPEGGEVPLTGAGAGDGTTEQEDRRRRRRLLLLLFLLGALLFLLGLAIWYLLFRQPVPIPVIPENQVPHFLVNLEGSDRPVGIAVGPGGDRIYVALTGTQANAVVVDSTGRELTKMLPPVSTGASHTPVWVARDPLTGEVYVSDRPTGQVYVYDASGTYQRQFTPTVPLPGWQPMGLAFDKAGNLYVTDLSTAPQQVEVFDRTGALTRTIATGENLNFPNGIAVDDRGYVYLADSNNGRLLAYDPKGVLQATIGRGAGEGNLGLPRGVAVDGAGHVFVVDSSGQAVAVYKQLGDGQKALEFLGVFGTQGTGDGQFAYPNGIAGDTHGHVYVTDTANNRVQVWSY